MNNSTHDSIWEWAEKHAAGTLTPAQSQELEDRLATDARFEAAFVQAQTLLRTFAEQRESQQMRRKLFQLHHNLKTESASLPAVPAAKAAGRPFLRRVVPLLATWRTAAVAASVALLLSVTSLLTATTHNGSSSAQYRQLSREIAAVKRSQNQLITNQNKLLSEVAADRKVALTEAVKVSGTGFALNNAGYLVTAYHVAQDADSLYIQTAKGDYYKATLIAFNPQADVAVLRVDDRAFRFAAGEVPYSFSPRKSGLGAPIYTLGFPQDEVVYSEGYVSAYNGYRGDSAQYRLSLPAEPGASGAPVLDAQGAVLGIVAGEQQGDATGATYAVSSKELLRLLKSLPKDLQPALPVSSKLGGLGREQQLEKLQPFTCIVRVYKP